MLDLAFIQENPEKLREMLALRSVDFDLEALLQADRERRSLIQSVEGLRGQRKEQSKQLGALKQSGQDISSLSAGVRKLGEELEAKEKRLEEIQNQVAERLLFLPNMPLETVPRGKTSDDNPVLRTWGNRTEFSFKPLDHAQLGERLGILDFERGVKISGARFTLSWGIGARLERALINFMLDMHTSKNGYVEVLPPFLVNSRALTGTGNLPKFKDDLFHIASHDLYLIPTAEVPLTNIHQDEILEESDLPKAYVAYTPCFRSEAGSYGKDTKGLIRQHQFNKVEIVRFVTPGRSHLEHELLTKHAEAILQELELPYRVVELCTGDLGFSACKTYDLEVWLPGQNAYREISSCSNFGDFQARRAKIRYKVASSKPQWLHTLNGSGLAVGRTLVAILENFQQKDGSVILPKALRPYLGGLEKIPV